MRLRADHVTLGRVVLLPLPVAMLHGAGPGWRLASLVAFVLLGLTDLIDGPLARRHGSTPIGPLLDNLSDRVFLAVVYCVLAEFGIVPLPLLQAMLVRELLVVSLRGMFQQNLRTWRGGQLKTTVQMFGAGFLLLLWADPDGRWFAVVSALALAASLGLGAAIAIRRRRLDWRALWAVLLTASLLAAQLLGGAGAARTATLAVIGVVTFGSAALLLAQFDADIRAALSKRPVRAIVVLASVCILPLLWAPFLADGPLIALAVTGLVGAEVAIQVLGNALRDRGREVRPATEIARLLFLGVAGLGVVSEASGAGRAVIAYVALAVLAVILYRRGRAIAGAFSRPPT